MLLRKMGPRFQCTYDVNCGIFDVLALQVLDGPDKVHGLALGARFGERGSGGYYRSVIGIEWTRFASVGTALLANIVNKLLLQIVSMYAPVVWGG